MTALNTSLRPLGMGELFDRAIRLYRRNFARFVGVIALVMIPLAGLNLLVSLFTYEGTNQALQVAAQAPQGGDPFNLVGPDYFFTIGATLLTALAQLVLVNGVGSAALTRMIADTYFGEEMDTLEAYRAVGNRWWTLVRAIAIYMILFLALIVWTIIPCIGNFTGPGMMTVLAGMVLPLVAPVVVMERFRARQSLRRAWELVRARFWWFFGFMTLLFLFNWVVVGGPSILANLALSSLIPDSLAENARAMFSIQTTIQSLVNLIFSLLYLPLQLACLTLVYYDLRVRSEGLDLVLASGEPGIPAQELIARSARLPSGSLFNGREFVHFITLTALMVVLYFILAGSVIGVLLATGVY